MHFRRVEGDPMKALLTSLLLAAVTLAGITASAAECYLPWNARSDLRMQWLQADCRYSFPQRDGFAGKPRNLVLKAGTVIDRFGHPTGNFLAPADSSYMGRAVPYDRFKMPYYRYEVVKPLRVQAGQAAPWFDQPGGGLQYKTSERVQMLVERGYLRQIW
jgi:hypothetical protein